MKILILNGSPRKNGTVATLLKAVAAPLTPSHDTEWIDVCKLDITFCTACMAFQSKMKDIQFNTCCWTDSV